jgi:hypothetical protein
MPQREQCAQCHNVFSLGDLYRIKPKPGETGLLDFGIPTPGEPVPPLSAGEQVFCRECFIPILVDKVGPNTAAKWMGLKADRFSGR